MTLLGAQHDIPNSALNLILGKLYTNYARVRKKAESATLIASLRIVQVDCDNVCAGLSSAYIIYSICYLDNRPGKAMVSKALDPKIWRRGGSSLLCRSEPVFSDAEKRIDTVQSAREWRRKPL